MTFVSIRRDLRIASDTPGFGAGEGDMEGEVFTYDAYGPYIPPELPDGESEGAPAETEEEDMQTPRRVKSSKSFTFYGAWTAMHKSINSRCGKLF